MKPSPFLLAALIGLASAGCYTGGEYWDPALASTAMTEACQGLAGDYNINQVNSTSIDVGNGQCYHFVLQRLGADSAQLRSITQDECESGMGKEVSGCKQGGETSYKNWKNKYVLLRSPSQRRYRC